MAEIPRESTYTVCESKVMQNPGTDETDSNVKGYCSAEWRVKAQSA